MAYLRILMLLVVVVVIGCQGSESESVQPPAALPAADNAKAILQTATESGELGSAAMELRESLEQLEDSEALLADLDAMEAMSNPEEIKAKAQELLDKL